MRTIYRQSDVSLQTLTRPDGSRLTPTERIEAQRQVAQAAADDQGPKNPADEVFNLSGRLHGEQIRFAESRLSYLSPAQVEHLAANTNLAARSPSFAKLLDASRTIEKDFKNFSSPISHNAVRSQLLTWIRDQSLTPAMAADTLTVLLTGHVTKHLALNLNLKKPLDLAHLADQASTLFMTDLDALKDLDQALLAMPLPEREKFLRATAYELSKIDQELVNRLVDNVGVAAIKEALPALDALPNDITAVASELSKQDALGWYLRLQRVPGEIKTYAPTAALKAKIEKASQAIDRADRFASDNGVDVSSSPTLLAQARSLYARAAGEVRGVLAADKLALQDPVVKSWMERRAKSLFVRSAVLDVESGTRAKNGFTQGVRNFIRHIPGLSKIVPDEGSAEPAMIDSLKKTLGFDPSKKINSTQRAALVDEMAWRTMLDPDAGEDPLVKVMMDPDTQALPHVHLLFAPGVVPISGVFEDTFKRLHERYGITATTMKTGFFAGEDENAAVIRKTYADTLAKDPAAKIVLLGYSQGAVNSLAFLDEMRSGPQEDREAASHVAAMLSCYGAHNGSTAAEDGVAVVKSSLEHLPWGKQLEYLLSGVNKLGHILAGGVDSLKRSTRHRFWEIANLPSDIPYASITAKSQPDEVPLVLKSGYDAMKLAAQKIGLIPENDTQVLFEDAPLGNEDTAMGRAVRKNCTNLFVHGHHWNPLTAHQQAWDPEPTKYAFPKTPQVEAHFANLAELGLLS